MYVYVFCLQIFLVPKKQLRSQYSPAGESRYSMFHVKVGKKESFCNCDCDVTQKSFVWNVYSYPYGLVCV